MPSHYSMTPVYIMLGIFVAYTIYEFAHNARKVAHAAAKCVATGGIGAVLIAFVFVSDMRDAIVLVPAVHAMNDREQKYDQLLTDIMTNAPDSTLQADQDALNAASVRLQSVGRLIEATM